MGAQLQRRVHLPTLISKQVRLAALIATLLLKM